jgi:sugar-specific transcriptional regulator TrmB
MLLRKLVNYLYRWRGVPTPREADVAILAILAKGPLRGLEIAERTGLSIGRTHARLQVMFNKGLVRKEWGSEDIPILYYYLVK